MTKHALLANSFIAFPWQQWPYNLCRSRRACLTTQPQRRASQDFSRLPVCREFHRRFRILRPAFADLLTTSQNQNIRRSMLSQLSLLICSKVKVITSKIKFTACISKKIFY